MFSTRNLLLSCLALLLLVAAWRLFSGGPSQATLTERALHAEESAERQQAMLALIATDEPQEFVGQVLAESTDSAVRAIAIQSVGQSGDLGAVDSLLSALDDDSRVMQASAAGALSRLLRYDVEFPMGASASKRRRAAAEIRKTWEMLKQYDLVDELTDATSLHYYFDQTRGKIFAAPSHLPDAFDLPSGPYQGMPAAVRAHVYSRSDCDDPAQRFVGWLVVPEEVLVKHNVALPAGGPPGDTAELLIRRPQDREWVYIASDEGKQIGHDVFGSSPESKEAARPCLPKKPAS